VWLLADFTITPGEIFSRIHAKLWLRMMYLFFRCAAGITANGLVDPSPYLEANNFAPMSHQSSRAAMLKSELWQRRVPIPARNSLPPKAGHRRGRIVNRLRRINDAVLSSQLSSSQLSASQLSASQLSAFN
jgi:hypothetical protein